MAMSAHTLLHLDLSQEMPVDGSVWPWVYTSDFKLSSKMSLVVWEIDLSDEESDPEFDPSPLIQAYDPGDGG